MKYCNDCFAKMDDTAKHCKSCQSRDLRNFQTLVTETPQDGVTQDQVILDDSSPRFKVDRQYLVEPKTKESDLPPKNLLYFPSSAQDREQFTKNAAKVAQKSERNALGRTIRSSHTSKARKRFLITLSLSVALALGIPTLSLLSEHKEVSVESISESIQGWIKTFKAHKSAVGSAANEVSAENPSPKSSAPQVVSLEKGYSVELEKAFFTTKYDDAFAQDSDGTTSLCFNVVVINKSKRLLGTPNFEFELQGSDLHIYPWDLQIHGDEGLATQRFMKPGSEPFRPGEKYLLRLSYRVPRLDFYTLKLTEGQSTVFKSEVSSDKISSGWFDFKPTVFSKDLPRIGAKLKEGQILMTLNSVRKARLSDATQNSFSPTKWWSVFDITITNTQDLPLRLNGLDFHFAQSDGTWPAYYADPTSQLVGSIEKGESRRTTVAVPYAASRNLVFSYERLSKQFSEYPNEPYVPQGLHWYVESSQIK